MKKILTVVGARPQFIKAAVVSRALLENSLDTQEILVHTGQHYDNNMSDIFFDELTIPRPKHHLGIGGGTHGQNTGRMLEKLEALMQQEKPSWVLVYGDTDSTLAGALAAAKLHIPVAHVEAGLRSFNRRMPEEINRVVTDHVSSVLFAPTGVSLNNLVREGVASNKVEVVGDVMFDAALFYRERAKRPISIPSELLTSKKFILCTVHRAENTDSLNRMKKILSGLASATLPIILPIHPRTKMRLKEMGLEFPSNVHVVDPVSYLEMVWLEINCQMVITDSGGVQKEAYFHARPCITMRDETEWTELVDLGVNLLVGVDENRISEALTKDLSQLNFKNNHIYGDGNAGQKIAKYLMENQADV
jgi:UDP-GlcNAc3NAcA epimerase